MRKKSILLFALTLALAVPVVGIRQGQLVDTFDAARSAGRRHDAIDIMAAEGTPVIAAAGDIACAPTDHNYNGGAGIQRACDERATSNLMSNMKLDGVLALGDEVPDGLKLAADDAIGVGG